MWTSRTWKIILMIAIVLSVAAPAYAGPKESQQLLDDAIIKLPKPIKK